MIDVRKLIMLLAIGACFSLQSFAVDQEQTLSTDQVQSQALELQAADVDALQLTAVEAEGEQNSNEIHQEATVGRAGLAGACRCFPDGNGGLMCQ